MTKLNAYLTFEGTCKEAMEFYHSCLGGKLHFTTAQGSPMEQDAPANMKDNIIHSTLEREGLVLMASDMFGGEKVKEGNMISLCLSGEETDIRDAFKKLSQGGKILHELADVFFGLYGDIVDKFGIRWMFQADTKEHHA